MSGGVRPVVGKGEEGLLDTKCFVGRLCLTVKEKRGPPHGIVFNLDIGPSDAIPKPPSDGLEKGLFGCEPARETLGGSLSLLAPDDLPLCENPAQEGLP